MTEVALESLSQGGAQMELLLSVLFVAAFILAPILAIAAPIVVFAGPYERRWLAWTWFLCLLACAAVAYVSTYHFVYSWNANTRVHGWPVPVVVFQRDCPTCPWLDYVGWTTHWGYFVNWVLFLGVPSLAVIVMVWIKHHREKAKDAVRGKTERVCMDN